MLDARTLARTLGAQDPRHHQHGLLGTADGGKQDRLPPTQARHDAPARPEGIRRQEGIPGVCKKGACAADAAFDLLYLDECEFHLHPTLTKVWTLRGIRPVVPAAGVNQRLCVYGAMNWRTGQTHYLVRP